MQSYDRHKAYVFLAIVFLVFAIILGKILYLQVFDEELRFWAASYGLRRQVLYPARGLIFDRNKKLLVYNKPIYELMVVPKDLQEFDTNELAKILEVDKRFLRKQIEKAKKYSYYRASKVYEGISQKKYHLLLSRMYKFRGFYIQKRTERIYPKPVAALVLGYIREVDKQIVDTSKYYRPGDYIGATGIERYYERYLRGKKGVRYFYVDAFGRIKASYKGGKLDTAAEVGRNLITGLDADLQLYAEKLMKNKVGAIVAIEPSTGEVLTMVSSPSYDPNLLTGENKSANYLQLLKHPLRPLFNRAVLAGQWPPGSTFKVVQAVIALYEGVINTSTAFACNYGFNTGSHIVRCHHAGMVDFHFSIVGSCNTYYCNVLVKLLRNRKYGSVRDAFTHWREILQRFGIGRKLGIDLPSEAAGVLYTADQYDKAWGKNRWGPLTIISLAIGQGELGLTTLQLANIAAIIGNRGWYITPHIVKEIQGLPHIDSTYLKKNYLGIDSIYFSVVADAMQDVVRYGTARAAYVDSLNICGKTGTAQNEEGLHNSVFIAFAPKYNPKIAVAVYVKNGGYGGSLAAPIASLIIEKYLTGKTSRPWLEQQIIERDIIHNPPVLSKH